jgi:ATP-dependent helicase HepA
LNSHIVPGQRYISTSEPSLGLGHILAADQAQLQISFPSTEEIRIYATASAPLFRVRFAPGDEISDISLAKLCVESISETDGLLTYHGQGKSIHESQLLHSLTLVSPEKRLLAGLTDQPRDFDLRLEALRWNANIRRSPAQGYTGARIDLIPHQLSIVAETSSRLFPRVLLADEVGLGKTIEACLILHRLHLTGRASRILILVPEPLVHQWFIELLRRFHLLFAIYDEERFADITHEDDEETTNPFSDAQLILCSISFLAESPERTQQAREAGFDLLIIDEAHHLEWSPDQPSPAYETAEILAREIPSLLLLTATPQQLGPAGHFARLRLLDPDRYADLDAFLAETTSYIPLAEAVESLISGEIPENIATFTAHSPRAAKHLTALREGDSTARTPLVSELIDTFGTGRVLFRNTREQLSGFPKRLPILHPLPPGSSPYQWLTNLVRELPESEKILLITNSPEAAITVQEKLLALIHIEAALFHEDLTLLQRDRHAAWFAETDGARILICSEIGSEGRNFQFARHLILFGLPRDPEVLEQRIGRLDRIGQSGDIHIHIPYGEESPSELHARWLHDALDAFSAPLKGATTLATELLPELDALAKASPTSAKFKKFLTRCKDRKAEIATSLATGHDRLLELGAPPASLSAELLEHIEEADQDPRFVKFAIRLFDHYGLDVTDLSANDFLLKRGPRHSETLADIPEHGKAITFSRATALAREDIAFLTIDHPMFRDAHSQLLHSHHGNATFAHWNKGQGKSLLLECAFVLEVIAPPRLHLDRFLPPTLLRIIIDHTGTAQSKVPPSQLLKPGDPHRIITQESFRKELFPKMLDAAKKVAHRAMATPIDAAIQLAEQNIGQQIARLEDLALRNPNISAKELTALSETLSETKHRLGQAQVRIDSLRLIFCS